MTQGPTTVHKALSLLGFFSEQRLSIGLSEMTKLSGFNKATTLRFLSALEAQGLLEQHPTNKSYTLGPSVLRLAQLRDLSVPLSAAARAILQDLTAATGETAHAAVVSGGALINIASVASPAANRVIIDPGAPMPFHASASGLIYLAFAPPSAVAAAVSHPLKRYTPVTVTERHAVMSLVDTARQAGVAKTIGTFEENVVGYAAPTFGPDGIVCGAIALSLPEVRATAARERGLIAALRDHAAKMTKAHGGQPDMAPTPPPEWPGDPAHSTANSGASQTAPAAP